MKIPLPPAVTLWTAGGGLVAGLMLGWGLWHPKPAPVETPLVAIHQADSSLVLQRAPDAHAKPGMIVPKGGTVERVIHLTVQPHPALRTAVVPGSQINGTKVANSSTSSTYGADSGYRVGLAPTANSALHWPTGMFDKSVTKPDTVQDIEHYCPPVHVDLALIRLKDGSHRVVAKAPDGILLSGIDIPVTNVAPVKVLRWSAGPVYNIGARGWGGAVTRDVGPFRIMGAVTQQQGGGATFLVGATVPF